MSSRTRSAAAIGLVLMLPLVVGSASADEEPPLQLVLTIDGAAHDVRIDRPLTVSIGGKPVRLRLEAKPNRELDLHGVRFLYPKAMTFEVQRTEGLPYTQWILDAKMCQVSLWKAENKGTTPAQLFATLRDRAIPYMFGEPKSKTEIDIKLGRQTLRGVRMRIQQGPQKLDLDICTFSVRGTTFALLFNDLLDQHSGTSTPETVEARRLLGASFRIAGDEQAAGVGPRPDGAGTPASPAEPATPWQRLMIGLAIGLPLAGLLVLVVRRLSRDDPMAELAPLGLPPGSVRALLMLAVGGTICAALLREVEVTSAMWLTLALGVAAYFSWRGVWCPPGPGPLGLPRGVVRIGTSVLAVVVAALVGWRWKTTGSSPLGDPAFMPLLAVTGYLYGQLEMTLGRRMFGGGASARYRGFTHAQAVVGLLAVVGLPLMFVVAPGALGIEGVAVRILLLAYVAYYFGAR